MTSTPDFDAWDSVPWGPEPSAEEVALAHELVVLARLEDETGGVGLPVPDVETVTDAEWLESRTPVPCASDLMLLDSIDPLGLDDPHAVLTYLAIAERVDAFTAALKARARVALAGAQSSEELMVELRVEHELAVATRSSRYVAGKSIERSRVLTTEFPAFLEALAAGRVSEAHCRVLVDNTRAVTDRSALASIGRVLLPKAARMTAGQFVRQVLKAVADFDPDAATRHVRARAQRSVWTRELEDGMSYLGMVHDTSTIAAIRATLDTDAAALRGQRRTAADAAEARGEDVWASTAADVLGAAIDDATGVLIGACRADALAARILGTQTETGDIDWAPQPGDVAVQLVIDLQTLRGEVDRHCLLDGQPVPAEVGRELAGYATAFRRMVTDPITGHLLDYGTQTYLPAPLRTYVLARDGGCRAPGCTVRDVRRLQMDHVTPFPEGGSDTANAGGLCVGHHQLKTAGHLCIAASAADGSCDWITSWGQRVHIPARPYLHDPVDGVPDGPDLDAGVPADPDPPPDDPPPF